MIDVKELIYDIDLKLNKIGTNQHQNINIEDKIIALNDAQINLVKIKFSENNIYKLGLDSFQKRYNDLESLIIKDKYIVLKEDNNPLKSWSADLKDLTPEYMLGIPGSEYVLANKENCKDNVLVINQVKHGDINIVLNNSNTSPSFEYQEIPGVISNHTWQVFTDGTFTPTKMYLWYIKYPIKVDFEGYYHFDDTESQIINSELPYYLKEEVVDIAVRNLALSSGNETAVNSSQIRIQSNE